MSHPDNVPSTSSAQRGFEVLDAAHLDARAGLETAAARLLIGKLTEEQLDAALDVASMTHP